MNRYVADPHWYDYITWYFFLGGIAAGAYGMARLIDLLGDESDRRAARVADYFALPLIAICGVLLIVDLGRPERFWHMMIQSNTYRPMFKWWSPMSAGSWGLSLFGAFSSASFLAALAEDGRLGLGRWSALTGRLRRGGIGRLFAAGGAAAAGYLGSYTGSLLAATNQPIWSDTTWLAPLFLASATSTGLAAIILLMHRRSPGVVLDRLERADAWAIGLELVLLGAWAGSLAGQGLAGPAFGRWPGMLIPAFVIPVGLVLPLILKRAAGARWAGASAALVLLGGFALRAAVVGIPVPLLAANHP